MTSCPISRQGPLRPGTSDEAMTQDGMTLVSEDVTQRPLDLARAAAAGVEVDVRRYVAA